MARPGVAAGKIRKRRDGIKKLKRAIGKSTFEDISVEGHCMGIQARAWRKPSQPANYDYASDGAAAVIRAGKMRKKRRPPVGALAWYYTGSGKKPGHVTTVLGRLRKRTIGNVDEVIGIVPMSYFDNYEYLGWCYPGDVPGWV